MPRKPSTTEEPTQNSPLRRSSRTINGVGTPERITTGRTSQTAESDIPAKVSKSRKPSTQATKDKVETKTTTRSKQAPTEPEATIPAKRGRKQSVATSDSSEQEITKPKPIRTRKTSKENTENGAPVEKTPGSRRNSAEVAEHVSTPAKRINRRKKASDVEEVVEDLKKPARRGRGKSANLEEEAVKPALTRSRRASANNASTTPKTPGKSKTPIKHLKDLEDNSATPIEVQLKDVYVRITPLKKRKIIDQAEADLELSIINESVCEPKLVPSTSGSTENSPSSRVSPKRSSDSRLESNAIENLSSGNNKENIDLTDAKQEIRPEISNNNYQKSINMKVLVTSCDNLLIDAAKSNSIPETTINEDDLKLNTTSPQIKNTKASPIVSSKDTPIDFNQPNSPYSLEGRRKHFLNISRTRCRSKSISPQRLVFSEDLDSNNSEIETIMNKYVPDLAKNQERTTVEIAINDSETNESSVKTKQSESSYYVFDLPSDDDDLDCDTSPVKNSSSPCETVVPDIQKSTNSDDEVFEKDGEEHKSQEDMEVDCSGHWCEINPVTDVAEEKVDTDLGPEEVKSSLEGTTIPTEKMENVEAETSDKSNNKQDMAQKIQESSCEENGSEEGESIGSFDSEHSSEDSDCDESDSFIAKDDVFEPAPPDDVFEPTKIKNQKENSDESELEVKTEDMSFNASIPQNISFNTSQQKQNKRSSMSIHENIVVDGSRDSGISQRINTLVESFCSNVKKGEISLNLALEYENPLERAPSKESVRILSDIKICPGAIDTNEPVEDLRQILNRKQLKRRLSKSLSEIYEEENEAKRRKKNERAISEEQLHEQRGTKPENIKKSVKNRTRRLVQPTTLSSAIIGSWVITEAPNINPSTSSVLVKSPMKTSSRPKMLSKKKGACL